MAVVPVYERPGFTVEVKSLVEGKEPISFDANHICYHKKHDIYDVSFICSGSLVTVAAERVISVRYFPQGPQWCGQCDERLKSGILKVAEPCPFEVIINGQKNQITQAVLSYDEIVEAAGLSLHYGDQRMIYSMTFSGKLSGSLMPGQSVQVEDGMIFNVCDTSNA